MLLINLFKDESLQFFVFGFFSSIECRFLCANGRCLNLGSQVCDQLNHCGDNSDEVHCPISTQHPASAIFSCESISLTFLLQTQTCLYSASDEVSRMFSYFSSEILRRLYSSHLQGVSVRRVLNGVSACCNVKRECVYVCVQHRIWSYRYISCFLGDICHISLYVFGPMTCYVISFFCIWPIFTLKMPFIHTVQRIELPISMINII